MKNVFLIDDHPVMRYGLSQLINAEEDLKICGEAGEASGAINLIAECDPDLVIVDISLPDKSGLELLKEIRAIHPGIATLVLSSHDESLYAERSLKAGALGYVMKEEAPEKLVAAIRAVCEGKIFVSEKMSNAILSAFSGRGKSSGGSPLEQLTDREFEVFELIGQGKGSRAIAGLLCISVSTVDAHRAHIKSKLELSDGNALVRHAVRWVESQ
ncbi:MAG: response regulator [Verrucomicrobiales bacterium]